MADTGKLTLKRTKLRLLLAIALTVCLLAFIWGNSAMPGETSGQLSGWVGQLLQKLFPFLRLDTPEGKHLVRKLAHFSEFAALGCCVGWLLGMLKKRLWGLTAMACGVAVAGIDEVIQIFSPGRHCSIVDVGIDSAGVLTGIGVLCLLCLLTEKVKNKRVVSYRSTIR